MARTGAYAERVLPPPASRRCQLDERSRLTGGPAIGPSERHSAVWRRAAAQHLWLLLAVAHHFRYVSLAHVTACPGANCEEGESSLLCEARNNASATTMWPVVETNAADTLQAQPRRVAKRPPLTRDAPPRAGSDAHSGAEFRATFRSAPGVAPAASTTPIAGPLGPVTTAATLAELRTALADPAVLSVTLAAHIALDGDQLEVAPRAQPGAVLALLGGACVAPAPGVRPLPAGTCALDAMGRSRVLLLRPGAALRMQQVALLRGAALQGGCVLAVAAQLNATASVFADCTASGDGGAVLALAGAAVTLSNCAHTQSLLRAFVPPRVRACVAA